MPPTCSESNWETNLETLGEQDGSKNMDFQRMWGYVLELFLEQPNDCEYGAVSEVEVQWGGGGGSGGSVYS